MNNSRLLSSVSLITVMSLSIPPAHARAVDAEAGGAHQNERAAREWDREPKETRERVENDMRQQEAQRNDAARAEAARIAEARKVEAARIAKAGAGRLALAAGKQALGMAGPPLIEGAAAAAGVFLHCEVAGPAGFSDRPGTTPQQFREQQERARAESRVELARKLENAVKAALLHQY